MAATLKPRLAVEVALVVMPAAAVKVVAAVVVLSAEAEALAAAAAAAACVWRAKGTMEQIPHHQTSQSEENPS